jgi:hypothetical protein
MSGGTYLRQCRNMRHCRLRRFELRCAKGPGPLGAPLDEGACQRQAIQPPQRRLFSWEAQWSALACANPNLCDFSKRRIFTLHIEVRIRYAQPRSRSQWWDFRVPTRLLMAGPAVYRSARLLRLRLARAQPLRHRTKSGIARALLCAEACWNEGWPMGVSHHLGLVRPSCRRGDMNYHRVYSRAVAAQLLRIILPRVEAVKGDGLIEAQTCRLVVDAGGGRKKRGV